MFITARIWLILILISLIATGCHSSKTASDDSQEISLVWPSPPAKPRIKYVKSFKSSKGLGFKINWLQKTINFITGSDKGRERFVKPFSVCVDKSGNLCVSDTGSIAVHYFDFESGRSWRKRKFGRVELELPVSVCKRGEIIYIADSSLGKILAVNERGKYMFEISDHLARPVGLEVQDDKLIVCDSKLHKLLLYDLEGNFLGGLGGRGTGEVQFNYPTHIEVDQKGKIFITDSMSHRIHVIDSEGNFLDSIGSAGDSSGHFNRPKGVAVDSSGNVYAVDAIFDNVQIFDKNGRFLMFFGSAGTMKGEFWMPVDIEYTQDNYIYVCDSYNGRIQVFQYVGDL